MSEAERGSRTQGERYGPVLAREKAGPPAPPRRASAGTILIIDDDPAIRGTTDRVLNRFGFATLTAPDGSEGLALVREHRDLLTAVLLDFCMPGMDGADVYRALREISSDLPVLFLSGFREADYSEQLGSLERAGFLQKPFRVSDLEAALRRVLGGG